MHFCDRFIRTYSQVAIWMLGLHIQVRLINVNNCMCWSLPKTLVPFSKSLLFGKLWSTGSQPAGCFRCPKSHLSSRGNRRLYDVRDGKAVVKGDLATPSWKIQFFAYYSLQGCDIKNRPPSICKHNHQLSEYKKWPITSRRENVKLIEIWKKNERFTFFGREVIVMQVIFWYSDR